MLGCVAVYGMLSVNWFVTRGRARCGLPGGCRGHRAGGQPTRFRDWPTVCAHRGHRCPRVVAMVTKLTKLTVVTAAARGDTGGESPLARRTGPLGGRRGP